jgi:4-amino-4-deoxy-L-arabinose transferase-like glycosyltransferase
MGVFASIRAYVLKLYSERFAGLAFFMRTKKVTVFLLALGFFLLLAAHLVFLDKFPPIDTNEPWWGDIAQQYNETGMFRSSLLDGVSSFGQNFVMAPRVVLFPEALVFKYFGIGLFQARIVSLLLYLGLVVVFWILLQKMIPHTFIRMGAFFLFLVNPLVISVAHTNRPDYVFVALAFLLAFLLVKKSLEGARFQYWYLSAAGLFVGLAGEAHLLSAFVSALSLGAMIITEVFQKRLHIFSLGFFIGGGLLGVIPLAVKVIGNFDMWREQVRIFAVDYFIPVISLWPNVVSMFAEEGIRYLSLVRWLDITFLLFLGIPILAFIAFRVKKERSFAVLILVYALGLSAVTSHKHVYYFFPIAPFIFLFWGRALSERFKRIFDAKDRWGVTMFKLVFALFLAPSIFLSIHAVEKETFWNQSYFLASVKEVIAHEPKDTLVVGEFAWWFGFYEYDYRATHWLWQRELQDDLYVGEVLSERKPVILLVDRLWLSRYTEEERWRYWHAWREGEQEELFRFTKEQCEDISSEMSKSLRMTVYKCL